MKLSGFFKDAALYGLGNIGMRTASLLLTPVYTYCLSMDDFGMWATLQITIHFMLFLMNVGMGETALRFTKECEETGRISHLLGTCTVIVLMGGAVVTGVAVLLLPNLFRVILHTDTVLALIGLTCIAALAQTLTLQIMSYYRAHNLSRRFIGVGLGSGLILLVNTIIALYVLRLGVRGALYAYIATYCMVYTIVALDIFPRRGVRVSRTLLPVFLRFGGPLVISSAGQSTIYGVSLYILSYSAGLTTVAVFSLGYKFATLTAIGVFLPFQLAFQPYVYGNLGTPGIERNVARLLTYLVLVTTTFSFAIVVGTRLLLPLVAPPTYSDAFIVMLWLLPGQALMGLHYFGETLLGAARRTSVLAALNSSCGAACVVLSLLLIPRFGWHGAVIASTSAALFVDSVELALGMRRLNLVEHVEWGRLFLLCCVFGALLVAAFALRHAAIPLFLGGIGAFFAACTAVVWLGPFWTAQERTALRGALAWADR